MGEILAVLSGKGGTGKTSVCAGVAIALAAEEKKVLCVDCDVGLRNLDLFLGMTESGALSFQDVMEGGYSLTDAALHPDYPGLSFLTAPVGRSFREIDPAAFSGMLEKARNLFDWIFLDVPSGVDAGFQLVSPGADRFLLVTGAEPAAVRDAARVGELLELRGKQNVRLIVNRIRPSLLAAAGLTVDDVMDHAGLPLLGIIREDTAVAMAEILQRPVRQYAPGSQGAKAYQRIADRLLGRYCPIKPC